MRGQASFIGEINSLRAEVKELRELKRLVGILDDRGLLDLIADASEEGEFIVGEIALLTCPHEFNLSAFIHTPPVCNICGTEYK